MLDETTRRCSRRSLVDGTSGRSQMIHADDTSGSHTPSKLTVPHFSTWMRGAATVRMTTDEIMDLTRS